MLPLYALGVMLSFTLSQAGMSRLMGEVGKLKPGESKHTGVTEIHYENGWRWKRTVNIIGSIVTGCVLVILIATKFIEGAWIIVAAIPLLVYMFHKINQHYDQVAHTLSTKELSDDDLTNIANVVVVPIADIHRGTLRALQYAKRISSDVRAVCVATTPALHERIEKRWSRFPDVVDGIHLEIIDYDYRDILTPLVEYIGSVNETEFHGQMITIVIPEFIPVERPARLLHNQTATLLRNRLRHKEDCIVIDVPYHI